MFNSFNGGKGTALTSNFFKQRKAFHSFFFFFFNKKMLPDAQVNLQGTSFSALLMQRLPGIVTAVGQHW